MNFRRAAAEVALTPTAFGQRIKQLEERLGEVLFDRTTRRMQLTEAGLALMDDAKQALLAIEGCLDAGQGGTLPLRFVVGSRFELARSWLAPALAEMCKTYPNYDIDMYCGSGDDILQRLNAGLLDCVVTSAPVSRGGWKASVLHPETYALVGSPQLLNRMPLVTAADCQHHVLVDIDHSLPLTRYVANTPGSPLVFRAERYLGSGEAMLEFVRAGIGVGVLPEYMVSAALKSGELVQLLPERDALTDTFRLLWKQDHPMTRAFSVLAEYLRKCPLQ